MPGKVSHGQHSRRERPSQNHSKGQSVGVCPHALFGEQGRVEIVEQAALELWAVRSSSREFVGVAFAETVAPQSREGRVCPAQSVVT
jgi:hypothetical protein